VGGPGVVLNTSLRDLYFENNGAPACIFLAYVNGITIDTANTDRQVVSISHDAFVVGTIANDQMDNGFSTKPIGSQYYSAVPTKVIKEDAYARGKIYGDGGLGSAVGSGIPGSGYVLIQDSDGVAGRPAGITVMSGALNDEHAVALEVDTAKPMGTPGATLLQLKNNGVVKARADLDGNLRLA